MRLLDDTRVRFVPNPKRDSQDIPAHTGKVADFTTDGFYRVWWDNSTDSPNPLTDFFNAGTVFRPDQLKEQRRVIEAKATVIVHPLEGESDDEAISRFFGENDHRDFFDISDSWEEDA